MTDYKALYFMLFGRLADAIELLEQTNYGQARDLLIKLLQDAEEVYISSND